jgi:hypothetical protein
VPAGYRRYRHQALHIFVILGERKERKFRHRNLHRGKQYIDEVDGSLYRKQKKKKEEKT